MHKSYLLMKLLSLKIAIIKEEMEKLKKEEQDMAKPSEYSREDLVDHQYLPEDMAEKQGPFKQQMQHCHA